jgi:phage gpG-like protein
MDLRIKLDADKATATLTGYRDQIPGRLVLGMKKAVAYLRTKIDEALVKGTYGIKTNTGRLRQSLTAVVMQRGHDVEGIVGTNLVYARIQEIGGKTRPHIIQAVDAKALRFWGKDGLTFRKLVHHPGSKIPAHYYMRNTLIRERDILLKFLEEYLNPEVKP